MNPGVYPDLPAAEYSAIPALRSTVLRELLRSTPAAARQMELGESKTSEAKEFGILLHSCVLEPERFERAMIEIPEFRGRGAKELRAEWNLRHIGRIPVKPKWREQLYRMRDAVLAHPVAGPMFSGAGLNELSVVWEDPMGILCKARFDRVYKTGMVLGCLDLKSTRSAYEPFFRNDVREYGYDVEACFYLRALEICQGDVVRPFHFVAAEKQEPWNVEVYDLRKSDRTLGTQKMLKGMEVYAQCLRTGEWPNTPVFGPTEIEEQQEGVA